MTNSIDLGFIRSELRKLADRFYNTTLELLQEDNQTEFEMLCKSIDAHFNYRLIKELNYHKMKCGTITDELKELILKDADNVKEIILQQLKIINYDFNEMLKHYQPNIISDNDLEEAARRKEFRDNLKGF